MRSAVASNPVGKKPGFDNLGQKVSVLFRLEDDASHPFSEVVGVLQGVDDSDKQNPTYSVIRRSGEVVRFDAARIVSWKVVPT